MKDVTGSFRLVPLLTVLTDCQKAWIIEWDYTYIETRTVVGSDDRTVYTAYPKCSDIDGNYLQKLCDDYYDICYCQDRLTGERLPGSGVAMNCDGQ